MQRDLLSSLSFVHSLVPIVCNNDTEGTPAASVDMQNADSAVIAVLCGISGDTLSGSLKYELIVEDSDDDTTFTPITNANLVHGATPAAGGIFATVDDAAEDPALFVIGYRGERRYWRVRADVTGTHTNGFPLAMLGIRGNRHLEGSYATS